MANLNYFLIFLQNDDPSWTQRITPTPSEHSMPERFQLRTLTSLSNVDTFAHDVRTGLSSSPKWLPSKYFYDEQGSKLFEQICTLPEYYLTRAGTEILQSHSHEIIGFVNHNASIIELGSGSASKTRILIEALLKHKPRLHYIPIDISRSALEESAASLLEDYRKLHITAYVGDYYIGLERLPQDVLESRLFLFLGSNIGNFEVPQAIEFLRRVRSVMRHEDRFLLSIDLKKEKTVLKAAYDDAQGITAAFNLNLLNRINRELDANFDLTSFRHRAHYNEQEGRIEVHLESLRPQRVRIRAARFEVDFEQGETIHTENSYKYSREQIQDLCTAGGLVLEKTWLDGQKLFSINLLSAQR